MKCEYCGKEHDGSYGSGRFCSDHCRRVYSGKRVNINSKQKCNFNVHHNNKHKRAPYGTWTCKYCGQVFEIRAKLEQHIWNNHYSKGTRPVWNKGLTKETSVSIAKIAQKNSESLKGISHSVSKETKEKLSEIRSKMLDSCTAGFQDVKWYKVKNLNGDEFTVRGHWEENVANKLTKDGILWTKNHCLKYMKDDGVKRTYNPDFYLPMINAYVEVKGYYSDKDKEKMKLVLEQNDIKIYFIDQYHYQDYINGKIQLSELLMKNNN